MNDKPYKLPNSKLIKARNRYLIKLIIGFLIVIILNVVTIITFSMERFLFLNMFLIMIDLILTTFFVMFSIKGSGFKKRFEVYENAISILPKCEIIKANKSFMNECVTYRCKINKSMREMEICYSSSTQNEPAGFIISFKAKSPFNLYIWKRKNETFETDNKNFLKFNNIMNKLIMGEEIYKESHNNFLNGKTPDKNNIEKIILIIIEILKELEKKGEPLPRNMMSEDFSFWFGPNKYTVCLNCEEIIGKWTNKNHVEVYKCPKCFNDTIGMVSFVDKDIKLKIKEIKNLVNK